MLYLRTMVYIIFFGLYFMLGCQYGKTQAYQVDYNPLDLNLDEYYDRDSGQDGGLYE